jgi:peptide/nickel transport system substrate-binding protein
VTSSGRAAPRRILAIALLTLLVAAGCSSGSGGGSATPSTGGGAVSVPADSSEIDADGVIKVGYDLRQSQGGGFYFDPTKLQSTVHDGWMYMLYGRLLRPTLEGELEPDLAESTEVVDPNTIEITLRDGLTFSDGTPFDAQAVKVGLERNMAEGVRSNMTEPFYSLTGIEVTSPTTLTLTISDGTAASWHDTFLAGFQSTITKPGQTDFTDPIGAGPFTVTSFQPEQSAVYAKSDTYWDAESITLGGIEIVQVATDQPQSQTAALQTEQIDLSITDASQIPGLTGNLELFTQADPNQTLNMMICKSSGPLADPRVRVAINKALERESIGDAVYAGTTEPMHQLWPAGHRFNDPSLEDVLAYDPAAARSLLAEAGYPDGFDLDMYLVNGVNIPEAAQVMEQQLADVGINANIIIPANYVADFLQLSKEGVGVIPGNAAGRTKLNQFSGDALSNLCKYEDPELDAKVAELNTVSDSSPEAVELWHEIQDIVVNDALGGFVLFRSRLAAFNSDSLGSLGLWPEGTVVVPDPRVTWIKAG